MKQTNNNSNKSSNCLSGLAYILTKQRYDCMCIPKTETETETEKKLKLKRNHQSTKWIKMKRRKKEYNSSNQIKQTNAKSTTTDKNT